MYVICSQGEAALVADNTINHIIVFVYSVYFQRPMCKSEVESIICEDINIRPWSLTPGATYLLAMIVN